ncbi:MAG: hypothetical protein OER95_13775, partial [Acidimicrobiia bacterium]|nr:hypothetical protein [Acidimicrobiia bacterium]
QALGLRVGPDGIRPDRSGVPRPASSFGDDEIMVAIGDLVDRVAAQSPLVIIVDDLHLADQRSVDTLRYLVTKPNKPAITVLIAWQQVLLPPEQPRGLRELSVLPHGLRISLRGIDEAAVRRLAAFRGHELSDAEVGRLHRSAGGNPALTIETLTSGLLADDEVSGTSARTVGSTPNLTEAVVGQASQIGVDASPILAVAGIFDGPFALSWLEDVVESPADGGPRTQPIAPGRCRDVVREAVYRGLLIELPEFGWFAFRHQIVRRTLAESLLLMDRAWYHGHFGRRFLQAGDMGHALYHLAQGSDQQDRRTALDIGLQLCSSLSDNLPVGDSTLRTLETLAREQIKGVGDSRLVSPLACRSALFLGWRANQRGDRATGRRWSHTALEAALTAVGTTNRRRKSAAPATALADLSAAALNLTGFSPHPLPGGQLNVERDDTSLNLLERAVSQLPNDDEALPVLEIELEWLTGSLLPSNASLNKATSLLEQALKSPTTSVAAMATTIYLRRFGRAIASERWVELIRTAITVQTTTGERLMLGFLEHRAMLELGLVDEAAGIIRTLGNSCERSGTRADATAARTLAIRHHLWTGDLQSAERLLDRPAEAEPAGADLVAVEVEQRAELGRLLARGDLLADASDELGRSTVDPATGAALLSQAGDYDRAAELLDQALKRLSTGRHQQIDEATLARVAMTASILLHKAAAAAVLEPLRSLGDEILVSSNSAVLLGPASFFTGLAAAVIEDRSLANEALDAAVAASLSKGGKPLAIQALIAQAKLAADYSDRDDVESLLRQAKELAVGLDIHWLDTQVV